jgi:hypothetical protein
VLDVPMCARNCKEVQQITQWHSVQPLLRTHDHAPPQPSPERDTDASRVWLLPSGVVMCVEQSLTDYTGWTSQEVMGKQLSSLMTSMAEVDG